MYRQIEARFWTAGSGKALRGEPLAQLAALYLMTAPGSNMVGLYYLALPTLAHELGTPIEGAREALRDVEAAGIALYDDDAELVYLPRMAAKQVGETLRQGDKRIASIAKLLEVHGDHRFARAFRERYGVVFNLPDALTTARPSEAPSMPLRSQEQEQEQEQETETATRPLASTPSESLDSASVCQTYDAVQMVFQHWARKQAKHSGVALDRLKLTKDRRGKIRARFGEGYVAEDLKAAVDGMFATAWNTEKGFTDVALACRDAAHVDRFSATVRPVTGAVTIREVPPAPEDLLDAGAVRAPVELLPAFAMRIG